MGLIFYGFVRLDWIDREKDADILSFVPESCIGVLETDNFDYFMSEFPQSAYAEQLDTLRHVGLFRSLLNGLADYTQNLPHGLETRLNHLMVSFHNEGLSRDIVVYFRSGMQAEDLVKKIFQTNDEMLVPRKEKYRGETIKIYLLPGGDFISCYNKKDVLAVSYQNSLIEQVIDADKDNKSLGNDRLFRSVYQPKSQNFMTLYGRTASVPILSPSAEQVWSVFDIYINSEVFYLSGTMMESDSCRAYTLKQLDEIPSVSDEGFLLVAGQEKVDSCISQALSVPFHSLFNECLSNLSCDASYIMVADIDKVASSPQKYEAYLSKFLNVHLSLFRPFIFSVQITKMDDCLSHILVFTYKE